MAEFDELLKKYVKEELNSTELQSFLLLAKHTANQEKVQQFIEQTLYNENIIREASNKNIDELFSKVIQTRPNMSSINTKPVLPFYRTSWFRYAAVILLLLTGIITYYIFQDFRPGTTMQHLEPVVFNNIQPGSDKAILTLSDGRQVQLSDTTAFIQDGKMMIENNNGNLKYSQAKMTGQNTMSTPRGGQYQLTLADGTKVWLNAASSITYPIAFTGNTREVSITGEVYFEVAKDVSKPFKVKGGGQEVEVLGTSFNINLYDNETSKTALLTGSIKINNQILKPGQAYSNGKITQTDPDLDIAWKNGLFYFKDASVTEVMNQLARWYDLEIVYERGIPSIRFDGKMTRDLAFSDVLQSLQTAGVHCRLEGNKKLIVLP